MTNKTVFSAVLLIFIGVFAYFLADMGRRAELKKNGGTETSLVIFFGCLIFSSVILYFKNIDIFNLKVTNGNELLIYMPGFTFLCGFLIRAIQYRYFEKGKIRSICPKCGAGGMRPNSKFCWNCGINLEAEWKKMTKR